MKLSYKTIIFIWLIVVISISCKEESGSHIFILSGQSNMVALNEKEFFTPIIEQEFGKEKIEIIKIAVGAQAIRRWDKDWKPPVGDTPKANPKFYNFILDNFNKKTKDLDIASITFIWMQGESDAFEKFSSVYEKSLINLYDQLSKDLNTSKINFVIGRLSDYQMNSAEWVSIRETQVRVANSNKLFTWVNTDDLNDVLNEDGKKVKDLLHLTKDGYKKLGERFAEESIKLIKKNR